MNSSAAATQSRNCDAISISAQRAGAQTRVSLSKLRRPGGSSTNDQEGGSFTTAQGLGASGLMVGERSGP